MKEEILEEPMKYKNHVVMGTKITILTNEEAKQNDFKAKIEMYGSEKDKFPTTVYLSEHALIKLKATLNSKYYGVE